MFIKEDDEIDIVLYYTKKDRTYEAISEKEFLALELSEEDTKRYSSLKLTMRELTWGLYNDIQETAMVDDGRGIGERVFSFKVYKETRLRALIKKWDAKDKDGKPVPVSDKTLYNLAPSIGESILLIYDSFSFLGEGEEKN